MRCVFCGSESSRVVDKRGVQTRGEIRRRRECLSCHKRFTTYERAGEVEIYVVKRDGRREVFDAQKLRAGIAKALEKRTDAGKVEILAKRIEAKLKTRGEREIKSSSIGQLVLGELKRLDKVAYLRFASVYRDFKEVDDFTRELQGLIQ